MLIWNEGSQYILMGRWHSQSVPLRINHALGIVWRGGNKINVTHDLAFAICTSSLVARAYHALYRILIYRAQSVRYIHYTDNHMLIFKQSVLHAQHTQKYLRLKYDYLLLLIIE